MSMEGFNNRLETVEKRSNELEDRSEETIHNVGQNVKHRSIWNSRRILKPFKIGIFL